MTSGFSGRSALIMGSPKNPTLPRTAPIVRILYLFRLNFFRKMQYSISMNAHCSINVSTKNSPISRSRSAEYSSERNDDIIMQGEQMYTSMTETVDK